MRVTYGRYYCGQVNIDRAVTNINAIDMLLLRFKFKKFHCKNYSYSRFHRYDEIYIIGKAEIFNRC